MVRNDQQLLKFFVDTWVVGTTSMFNEASKLEVLIGTRSRILTSRFLMLNPL